MHQGNRLSGYGADIACGREGDNLMKIGVAAMGETLDAQVSGQFGRCPYFVVIDSETLACTASENPGKDMPGGAGPAAVQALADSGVEVAVAGKFGPKAEQALKAAGIRYVEAKGLVREAVAGQKA